MLLLAVSALVISSASHGPGQLNAEQNLAWARVQPSVVYLDGKGVAVLVDPSGWFLVDRQFATSAKLTGHFSDGAQVDLSVVRIDDPTGLALLRAEAVPARRQPIGLFSGSLSAVNNASPLGLIAVLQTGPISAELVNGQAVGVLGVNRRLTDLSEIQFEGTSNTLGGAILCTMDGKLIGMLNATLEAQKKPRAAESVAAPSGAAAPKSFRLEKGNYGPGKMTVAYSVAPSVLGQVIKALMAPSHEVERPAIGVLVKDAGGMGAYVTSVNRGSTASWAGVKEGDIILEVAGKRVKDKFQFARAIDERHVGDTVVIKLLRLNKQLSLNVQIGKE